jgi:hypothetical protein
MDCKSCSTSPDGVFQLMTQQNGIQSLYSLSFRETKTREAVNTVDDVERRVLFYFQWVMVNAGTQQLRQVYQKLGRDHRFVNMQQQHESTIY